MVAVRHIAHLLLIMHGGLSHRTLRHGGVPRKCTSCRLSRSTRHVLSSSIVGV